MEIKEAIEYLNDVRNGIHIPAPGIELPLLNDKEKEAIDLAIAALKKQEQGDWIPCAERLPEEYGEYRITWKTSRSDKMLIADSEFDPLLKLDNEHGRFKGWLLDDYIKVYPGVEVIAWKPLEDPYTPPEK